MQIPAPATRGNPVARREAARAIASCCPAVVFAPAQAPPPAVTESQFPAAAPSQRPPVAPPWLALHLAAWVNQGQRLAQLYGRPVERLPRPRPACRAPRGWPKAVAVAKSFPSPARGGSAGRTSFRSETRSPLACARGVSWPRPVERLEGATAGAVLGPSRGSSVCGQARPGASPVPGGNQGCAPAHLRTRPSAHLVPGLAARLGPRLREGGNRRGVNRDFISHAN
jgi:hypothetical protein